MVIMATHETFFVVQRNRKHYISSNPLPRKCFTKSPLIIKQMVLLHQISLMSQTVLSEIVFFFLKSLYLSFLSDLNFFVWLFPGRKTPNYLLTYLLVVATHTELQRLKTGLY